VRDRGVDDRAAHRGEVDADRLLRRVARQDGRVVVELVGLERRQAVEVVADRLAQVLLDGRGKRERAAQCRARRDRESHAPRGGRAAGRASRDFVERARSRGGDGLRVAVERDRPRDLHRERAVAHHRPPQRRDVAVERDHRPQAATRDRVARA